MTNRGAVRLNKLFPGHGGQTKLANELGIGQSVVSRWMSGKRKPDPANRAKLQSRYRIDWRSWDEGVEAQKGSAA